MRNLSLSCAGRTFRRAHGSLFLTSLGIALAAAALPAVAQAQYAAPGISAALRSADASRELKTFYRVNGYRPIWARSGVIGPEADVLLGLLATADADGLDPGRYRIRQLEQALDRARDGNPRSVARAEMLLSRSFADYVRDMRRPREVGMHWVDREVMPTLPTVPALLGAASQAPSLRQYLETMGWMHPVYAQLRRAAASQQPNWTESPRVPVPAGGPLRVGDTGYRVEILRQRLGLDPGDEFDVETDAALRQFQRDRGMPGDGILGPRTLAALNGERAPAGDPRLLRLNMERARVLPPASTRHVLVDTASQRLWLYENGRVVDSMKVIVGKPEEQTPMMAGLIRYASVNPYWNIPPDLVRKRIVPQVAKGGPRALKGRYQVVSAFSTDARVIDPAEVNWQAVASGQQDLAVRQMPGGDNAMGRVKYMFPNELGIYLHDTPERNLFGKPERRFSSGCVRVEDANRLGQWLFGRPLPVKTKTPEQQVNLPKPVPVYITYLTAAPEGSHIVYRTDHYGRDAVQMAGLTR